MHNFKQYLDGTNTKIRNEVNLLIRKLIDNIHYAHIEKKNDEIIFNVGEAAQDKKYSNLKIRLSNSHSYQDNLYQSSNDHFFILINIKKELEPNAKFIISLLANNNERLKKLLAEFIKNEYYSDEKNDNKISSEINEDIDTFYEKIKGFIGTLKSEYNNSVAYVKDHFKNKDPELGFSGVAEYSIKNLKNNIFGKNEKEFMSKITDKFESEFKFLSKENKEIVTKRINDFYNHHLN